MKVRSESKADMHNSEMAARAFGDQDRVRESWGIDLCTPSAEPVTG
jgi:hypothetical protein